MCNGELIHELKTLRAAVETMQARGIPLYMRDFRRDKDREYKISYTRRVTTPESYGCIVGNLAHLEGISPRFRPTDEDVFTKDGSFSYVRYAYRTMPFIHKARLEGPPVYWRLFGSDNPSSYAAFFERLDSVLAEVEK